MRGVRLGVALAFGLAACGNGGETLSIVLDLPQSSSASYPFGEAGVDTMRLAVARSGDDTDLLSTKEEIDDGLSLDAIPFGRDLVLHLFGEQDGIEVAYGRSCSFSYEEEGAGPDSMHVYFSRLVRWGDGPSAMVENRVGSHAFRRENETVVIAGGATAADVELFNPRTGELSIVDEAPLTAARRGGTLSALGGDMAVLVGGTDEADAPVGTIELLPNLRDSLEAGLLLRDHAAAGLVGGGALVVGGAEWNGVEFVASASAWEVSVGEGGAVAEPTAVGSLATARSRHSATRVSDEVGAAVLVAGGLDNLGAAVTTAEVYRPLASVFEPVTGTLTRWDHSAVRLPGGVVLIIGGFQPSIIDGTPEPARDLVLFDPIGGTFAVAGQLPTRAPVTDFTLTTLPDGRVLLAGGRDAAGAPTDAAFVVRFDVINGLVDVSLTDSLSTARAEHAATLLCDGTILVTGGEVAGGGGGTERYNPTVDGRR